MRLKEKIPASSYNKINYNGKEIINKNEVLDYVKTHDFEVLIVLGAGDLDNQVPQIKKLLESKLS